MAGAYRTSAANGTSTDNTPVAVTIVPAVNDAFYVATMETGAGGFATGTLTDDNGGVYDVRDTATIPSVGLVTIWARRTLVPNTTSTIVTYTAGSTVPVTGLEVVVVAVSGMSGAGLASIRQYAHNNGAAGAASVTFSVAPLTTNPIIMFLGDTTNPPGLTAPASFTNRQNVGQTTPTLGAIAATVNSGVTATTISWGSNPATAWASVGIELDISALGLVYQDFSASYKLGQSNNPGLKYTRQNLFFPRARREASMIRLPVTKDTAVTIPVFMRGVGSDLGVAGLTLVVKLRKVGGAYATITPFVVVDRGGGMYDVTLTSTHTDTLGASPLRVSAVAVANLEDVCVNDEIVLDVITPYPDMNVKTITAGVIDRASLSSTLLQSLGVLDYGVLRTGGTSGIASFGTISVKLATSANGVHDNAYVGSLFVTIGGNNDGTESCTTTSTTSRIRSYDHTTQIATLWTSLGQATDNTTKYMILANSETSATDIATAVAAVQADVDDIQTRLPAALLVSGGIGLMKASIQHDGISLATSTAVGNVQTAVDDVQTAVTATHASVDAVQATVDAIQTDTMQIAGISSTLDIMSAVIDQIAGLLHVNSMVDKYVYNVDKGAVSFRLRVFANATALGLATIDNDDDLDSEIARYTGTATFNVDKTLKSYSLSENVI